VPDVTNQDEASARSALRAAGFTVRVQTEDVTDPALDGIVLAQDPTGGEQAEKGAIVLITVGRLPIEPAPE
jgi:serine/threonine-protein kinase